MNTTDKDNIDHIISELRNVQIDKTDLSKSYNEIKALLFKIIPEYLDDVNKLTLRKSTTLFRVRKNHQNLLFTTPSELSYPPHHLTYFGRANLIRNPVYYCSDNSTTSILESKPKKDEYLTLSECELIDDANLNVIGHCPRYTIRGDISLNQKKFDDYTTELVNKQIDVESDYLYSATLADVMFSDQELNGIMYPSIYSKGKADNIALRVEHIDHLLRFKSARQFKVIERTNENNLVLECVCKSDKLNVSGHFLWEKINYCERHKISFDTNPLIHENEI